MNRYVVEKKLGSGSYGSVFVVHSTTNIEKKYVMKKIPLKGQSQKEKNSAKQEVKLLQTLQHPFIVRYIDSFMDEESNLCIVMSFCKGGDLSNYLQKNYTTQRVPEKTVLKLFVQSALALYFIHNQKVLHRDLKSQNIFLSEKGNVKLGDFGIAKVFDESGMRTCEQMAQTTIGTPLYMSPEQCGGSKYSYKSDVWALGVILYEMVNQGALPFKGKNIQMLFLNIQKGYYSPIKNVNHYNSQLVGLITKCLQTKPSKRPTLKEILQSPIIVKYIRQQMLTLSSTGELVLAQDQVEDIVPEGEMANLVAQLSELGILNSKIVDSTPPSSPVPSNVGSVASSNAPSNPNHIVAKKVVQPPPLSRNQSPVPPPSQDIKSVPRPQILKVQPSAQPLPSSRPSSSNPVTKQKKIDQEIVKLHKEQQRVEKMLEQMRKDKEEQVRREEKIRREKEENSFSEFSKKFQNLNVPSKFESKQGQFSNEKERILFEKQQKRIQEEEEEKRKLQEARIESHANRMAAKNQQYNQFHNQNNILASDKGVKKELAEQSKVPNDVDLILQRQAEIDSEIEKEYSEMINLTNKKIETLQRKKESILNLLPESERPPQDTMFGDSDDSETADSEDIEYETQSEDDNDSSDEEEEEEYGEDEYYDQNEYDDVPVVGRLEDRVSKLISQNEEIFGKDRFQKLYSKYKEIYNNDQIQSEEAKLIPRREILGNDEPQLRKYCHYIEELIFVQDALL